MIEHHSAPSVNSSNLYRLAVKDPGGLAAGGGCQLVRLSDGWRPSTLLPPPLKESKHFLFTMFAIPLELTYSETLIHTNFY